MVPPQDTPALALDGDGDGDGDGGGHGLEGRSDGKTEFPEMELQIPPFKWRFPLLRPTSQDSETEKCVGF